MKTIDPFVRDNIDKRQIEGNFTKLVDSIFVSILQEKVIFDEIPQDYNHLMVISSQRITGSNVGSDLTDGRFNDDAGNNYHTQRFGARSDNLYHPKWTDTDYAKLGWSHGDKAWEGAFVGQELKIFDYANPNKHKHFYANCSTRSYSSDTHNIHIENLCGSWSKKEGIEKIEFFAVGDGFAPESRFDLYAFE